MNIIELERPKNSLCDICPDGAKKAGDVLCDLCNLCLCTQHSWHLLMTGPMQRRTSHRIVCYLCAMRMVETAASNPAWEEQATIIPRTTHAEIEPKDFEALIAKYHA